ncbi:MAG: CGNR zinc finger domain-containing protein [Ktedonobacteraceae bacterium]|nr:CGNR zinc finger domain-containing protein [Ktedonobacteraceae bacterium]
MDVMCLDFINSEFRDFRGRWIRDLLQDPGWLAQFLAKWDLQVDGQPDVAVMAAFIELRALLRRMTESLVQGQIAEQDVSLLNTILARVPLYRSLVSDTAGYRLAVDPAKKDWHWVQAEIAASFVHLLVEHDPRRLKVCANEHCRGVFYDESKSRTKRYCTADKCANLVKVRRFRARHRASSR